MTTRSCRRVSTAARMLPTISSREINSFPSKWPHHFGACWVLDLNGAGAGLLQDANRVGNVDGVAETGVNVDDQRQVDHTTDSHHMLGDLAQVHESEVWQAKSDFDTCFQNLLSNQTLLGRQKVLGTTNVRFR
jgi:hypothetical protein